MGTIIKNGKLPTFNICIVKLICILILLLSGHTSEAAPAKYPKNNGKWVIVIDPGHGGIDPGALGSFSKEKNISLAVALKTGKYLTENLDNVTVIYTRDKDVTVDLVERPKIANKNKADLFISIHANGHNLKNIMGAETWIMGPAKDQENLEVAMKENEVIFLEKDYSTKYQGFDPKSPESYIMFTLMQNQFQKQSTDLASKVQTQFKERVSRKDRGVKQAGFWVLFNTTMPSILIELGFITNPAEEKYLNSSQGQDYLASAIFRACRDYLNEIDTRSRISVQQPEPVVQPEPEPGATLASPPSTGSNPVFMVQVATSSSKQVLKPENFKGLKDIIEIASQERFKYATGQFANYPDAVKYRKKIEALYPDAFVIAVKDNKILPLQQALDQNRKK